MYKTPLSVRPHVGLFGGVNAGKSSLFNAILEQKAAIVSAEKGTTTDPIIKAMELIPFGPIALVDTAGFFDESVLGKARKEKTDEMLTKIDLALYVCDVCLSNEKTEEEKLAFFINKCTQNATPFLIVFSKTDQLFLKSNAQQTIDCLKKQFISPIFVSANDNNSVIELKEILCKKLESMRFESDHSLLKGLVPKQSNIVLVVKIDSETPKSRLILPQVQLLRDAIDNGFLCHVVHLDQLSLMLNVLPKVDLVVADSQIFSSVSGIVTKSIPLTSFSMLLARQKGDFQTYLRGANAIDNLANGDNILIAEACTHSKGHDDIGQIKIPTLLQKKLNKNFNFDFVAGHDFPKDVSKYNLIVHCGACMITRKETLSRVQVCLNQNVPITNYGILLAKLSNILERCCEIFFQQNVPM